MRPGQPLPELRARLLAKTHLVAPDGITDWSLRKMAAIIGVGQRADSARLAGGRPAAAPGGTERHSFEYYRHGRLSLFAALSSADSPLDCLLGVTHWFGCAGR